MADYEIAEATILSKGDIQQIHYEDQKTGQPKVFTKFTLECLVRVDDTGDESVTFEANGKDYPKLNVGSKYAFEMQDKGQYNDVVRKFTLLEEGETQQEPTFNDIRVAAPEVKPHQTAQTAPPKPPVAAATATPKPDLPSRWREYNTTARTSQMQATERVGQYIDLLIAGKLLNDAGEVVDKVRKGTVENWYVEELNRFWFEHNVRVVQDNWGRLDGSSGRENEVS